jgi:hypothetical protein
MPRRRVVATPRFASRHADCRARPPFSSFSALARPSVYLSERVRASHMIDFPSLLQQRLCLWESRSGVEVCAAQGRRMARQRRATNAEERRAIAKIAKRKASMAYRQTALRGSDIAQRGEKSQQEARR